MPLTTCPDCGHSISTIAPSCPSCGRPLQPKSEVQEGESNKPQAAPTGAIVEKTTPSTQDTPPSKEQSPVNANNVKLKRGRHSWGSPFNRASNNRSAPQTPKSSLTSIIVLALIGVLVVGTLRLLSVQSKVTDSIIKHEVVCVDKTDEAPIPVPSTKQTTTTDQEFSPPPAVPVPVIPLKPKEPISGPAKCTLCWGERIIVGERATQMEAAIEAYADYGKMQSAAQSLGKPMSKEDSSKLLTETYQIKKAQRALYAKGSADRISCPNCSGSGWEPASNSQTENLLGIVDRLERALKNKAAARMGANPSASKQSGDQLFVSKPNTKENTLAPPSKPTLKLSFGIVTQIAPQQPEETPKRFAAITIERNDNGVLSSRTFTVKPGDKIGNGSFDTQFEVVDISPAENTKGSTQTWKLTYKDASGNVQELRQEKAGASSMPRSEAKQDKLFFSGPSDASLSDLERAATVVQARCSAYGYKGTTCSVVQREGKPTIAVVISTASADVGETIKRLLAVAGRRVEMRWLYEPSKAEQEQFKPETGSAPAGADWVEMIDENGDLLGSRRIMTLRDGAIQRSDLKLIPGDPCVIEAPAKILTEYKQESRERSHILFVIDGKALKNSDSDPSIKGEVIPPVIDKINCKKCNGAGRLTRRGETIVVGRGGGMTRSEDEVDCSVCNGAGKVDVKKTTQRYLLKFLNLVPFIWIQHPLPYPLTPTD